MKLIPALTLHPLIHLVSDFNADHLTFNPFIHLVSYFHADYYFGFPGLLAQVSWSMAPSPTLTLIRRRQLLLALFTFSITQGGGKSLVQIPEGARGGGLWMKLIPALTLHPLIHLVSDFNADHLTFNPFIHLVSYFHADYYFGFPGLLAQVSWSMAPSPTLTLIRRRQLLLALFTFSITVLYVLYR